MREGRGLSFRSELPTQPEGLGLHRLSLEEPYLQGSLPQEFTQMQTLERGPQGRNRQSSGYGRVESGRVESEHWERVGVAISKRRRGC